MYIEVLLELKNKQTDCTFTYKVPDNLIPKLKIGKRVKVPFNNRSLEGYILEINEKVEKDFEILEIEDIIDEESILNEELLEIGEFLKENTLCSLSSAYSAMLPKALKASLKTQINKKYETNLALNIDYNEALKKLTSPRQKEIIELIHDNDEISKKEANEISISSVKTLLEKKIIKEKITEVYRLNQNKIENNPKKILNSDQTIVFEKIKQSLNQHEKFLLFGVTGSGKTEVYMQVIEEVLKQEKTAIVLVPEISLTPQLVTNFKSRLNKKSSL